MTLCTFNDDSYRTIDILLRLGGNCGGNSMIDEQRPLELMRRLIGVKNPVLRIPLAPQPNISSQLLNYGIASSVIESPDSIEASLSDRINKIAHDHSNPIISSPLIDAMGHSTNILILSLFLNSNATPLSREEVRGTIKAHKKALMEHENEFAPSRIRDGNSTINYWIDHLVTTGIINKTGYPIKFTLNESHPFIECIFNLFSYNIDPTLTLMDGDGE